MSELIFEKGKPGRMGVSLPSFPGEKKPLDSLIPGRFLRKELPLPELSEGEVVRHYTNLSRRNFSLDTNFYPLGSCTMKYNPKINEVLSSLEGFTCLHPYQGEDQVQGALQIMSDLEEYLSRITGMDAFTLQPAAGAHGELCGLLVVRAYFNSRGEKRDKVIIPDSAHGTNPASAVQAGYRTVQVKTDSQGHVCLEDLRKILDADVACLMLTNPSTIGLFETNIGEIHTLLHRCGSLLYGDGANMNALLGQTLFGDMGFDLIHLNLHKTFASPHGGGGPGAGPLGVKKFLEPFLPKPRIRKEKGRYVFNYDLPSSVGRMKTFYGNFQVMIKSLCYILSLGAAGLKEVSTDAVINANYLRVKLRDDFHLPFPANCLHEVVFSGLKQKEYGVKTVDMAKRLIDFDIHPPTVYFPVNIPEAIMIEPTETETRETLDNFIAVMKKISREARENPAVLRRAPHFSPVGRLDEGRAGRELKVTFKPGERKG